MPASVAVGMLQAAIKPSWELLLVLLMVVVVVMVVLHGWSRRGSDEEGYIG